MGQTKHTNLTARLEQRQASQLDQLFVHRQNVNRANRLAKGSVEVLPVETYKVQLPIDLVLGCKMVIVLLIVYVVKRFLFERHLGHVRLGSSLKLDCLKV